MKRILLSLILALAACDPAPRNPDQGRLGPGQESDLYPLVVSLGAQTPITWAVTPGGGTISGTGLYTAPTCAVLLAALPPGTDLLHAGQVSGVDTVTASWPGGSVAINVTTVEAVLGVDVTPVTATTGPGGTITFVAVVHYTCHDQTTAP